MNEEDDDSGDGAAFGRRWGTWVLAALNFSVFLAMVLDGASPIFTSSADAMAAGGVDPVRVWDGEVWRLLTGCFVHLGIWHLGLNLWVFLQLGRALERLIGSARLILVYLSSGMFGFALSVATQAKQTAGASGAIFGVTGALLALALLLRHRELGRLLFRALLPFVAATLALGFLVPMVDNSAHVGGLVFGFLLCLGLSAGDRSFLGEDVSAADVGRGEKLLGASALLLSGILFLSLVAYAAHPVLSPRYQVKRGLEALLDNRLEDAQAAARDAARIAPADGVTFVLLGRLKQDTARTDEDRAEAVRLLKEGVRRFGSDDPGEAFVAAQVDLALLGGGTEELPFEDTRTVAALCDGALALIAEPVAGDPADGGARANPIVKNECAWVKLKSTDPSVHDPQTALVLAREAVKESGGTDTSIVHTLAEALAQNGDPGEGLAILERLAAEGRGAELPGGNAFLARERDRLKRLVDDAEPRPTPPTAGPATAPGPAAENPAPPATTEPIQDAAVDAGVGSP